MKTKQELSELMGESNIRKVVAIKLPIVRFNGLEGKFKKLELTSEGYADPKDVGQIIEGVIVGIRMQLAEYNKNYRRETNEYDAPSESVRLWERNDKSSFTLEDGLPVKLREKYQMLRSRRWLYMVINGELVKFMTKGSSLGYLFDYLNEFNSSEHLFEFKTVMQPVQEEGKLGKYWAVNFSRGPAVSEKEFEVVAKEMQRFHENRLELKKRYVKAESSAAQSFNQPVKDELSEAELDVNPEDLPY